MKKINITIVFPFIALLALKVIKSGKVNVYFITLLYLLIFGMTIYVLPLLYKRIKTLIRRK
jgi:archaellum biogenesis protein FlaJ (TadC family)